jgi:dTDP-4-amino-4,6-dideoxygalactose transaminase
MSNGKPIPLIDVHAQNEPLKAEILAAITKILDTSSFILGPEVKALEDEFLRYTGVKHAISCASGSDALLLPLMAAEVGPGDEVLVPSFTFYATAGAVARLGATPVFVDSDDTYNISLEDLARKITPKTKAVIPVHLFGQMVDMPALQKIVAGQKQKIWVIEDCAQSIGAGYGDKQAGTFGDYGAYSFYPTKNLGAIGDAGMMSALGDEQAERLKMLRVHGSKQRYYHELVGTNSRLDSIQAAVLRIKLRHLKGYEAKREHLAQLYTQAFRSAELEETVQLPLEVKGRRHVWNQYTIRAKNRDGLKKFLADRSIGSEVYYPLPMHKQEAFRPFLRGNEKLPVVDALEKEVLSVPMYPELDPANVGRVVEAISAFYRS